MVGEEGQGHHAGVVDPDVDSTESVDGQGGEAIHRFAVTDVNLDGLGLATGRDDGGCA